MPEVRVSPGVATVLLFDLPPGRIEVEGREHFRAVGVDGAVLTLVPAESLHDVEQVRLTAHFADGAAPSSAIFLLRVVPPALVERQVEVHRRPRTLESFQQELARMHAERQQCVQELERLRAEPERVDGLSGLLVAGHLNSDGVPVREVGRELIQLPRNPIAAKSAWTYRAANRVAVELRLSNPKLQSWQAEGASLEDKAGVPLRVVRVWQEAPLLLNETKRIVVEAEVHPKQTLGTFTLSLWEAGGRRAITLGNVTFP